MTQLRSRSVSIQFFDGHHYHSQLFEGHLYQRLCQSYMRTSTITTGISLCQGEYYAFPTVRKDNPDNEKQLYETQTIVPTVWH